MCGVSWVETRLARLIWQTVYQWTSSNAQGWILIWKVSQLSDAYQEGWDQRLNLARCYCCRLTYLSTHSKRRFGFHIRFCGISVNPAIRVRCESTRVEGVLEFPGLPHEKPVLVSPDYNKFSSWTVYIRTVAARGAANRDCLCKAISSCYAIYRSSHSPEDPRLVIAVKYFSRLLENFSKSRQSDRAGLLA